MLFLAAIAAVGCDINQQARVHIDYRQVANFQSYRLSPDSLNSTAAGQGMFILYRFTKITNTGPQAQVFQFSKESLNTVQQQLSEDHASGENILLGVHLLSTATVQPAQTLTKLNGLGCVIMHAKGDPQALASMGALVDLTYDLSAGQPVSMHRVSGNTSTGLIIGDALPGTLQNLCPGS